MFCGKFIHDTAYRILSESAKVCRRYDENISADFSLGHGVKKSINHGDTSNVIIRQALKSKQQFYSFACKIVS